MSDSYRKKTAPLRLCIHLIVIIEASISLVDAETHYHPTMTVSAPHKSYICPEGANVTMLCMTGGTTKYSGDQVKFGWLFTPHQDQRCQDDTRPRIPHSKNHSHFHAEGVYYHTNGGSSWVTLVNVAHADQGRYCCVALDIHRERHHAIVEQKPHDHVLLTITPRRPGNTNCTVINHTPSDGSVAAALLATAGCIMGILLLPLMLLLVYKQRQTAQSNRRAHELVRMDSEARGHDNPVFLGGSPQSKTRTVSQIMTRQSSETGRHLLSEPSTPFSPPCHGDVFFPSQEPILECPEFMQV